ncbi:MAG: transposase [Synechococcus sp. SB0670_bin_20]|nr:transposase [Synechococcus sp. SB0670_bin_20]
MPATTTIVNCPHLLERRGLGKVLFETVKEHRAEQGLKPGKILDASMIAAPSATKNRCGERDGEMEQPRKGKQWHLGMKLHIGVDAPGLVHSLVPTAANVHDPRP